MTSLPRFAFAISMAALAAGAADFADLKVTVKDVHNATGTVYLVVYDQTNYGKAELAKFKEKAPAAKGDVIFVIHNLPPGNYAASSYHNENGNGKFDKNSLGVPTEGYGFSNDAQGAGGPPKFSQAAFDFDGKTDKHVTFSLNY